MNVFFQRDHLVCWKKRKSLTILKSQNFSLWRIELQRSKFEWLQIEDNSISAVVATLSYNRQNIHPAVISVSIYKFEQKRNFEEICVELVRRKKGVSCWRSIALSHPSLNILKYLSSYFCPEAPFFTVARATWGVPSCCIFVRIKLLSLD